MITINKSNTKISNIELNYANTAGGSAVSVDGAAAGADISVIRINAAGTRVYGIRALNKARVTLDNTAGISVSGTGTSGKTGVNKAINSLSLASRAAQSILKLF